jgi:hypothetical protein
MVVGATANRAVSVPTQTETTAPGRHFMQTSFRGFRHLTLNLASASRKAMHRKRSCSDIVAWQV